MKKAVYFGLSLIMGLSVLFLSGCSSFRSIEEIQKANVFVVATNAEFPPFEYIEGNEFKGLDMDIARIIAAELGVPINIQHMAFDAVIGSVTSNRADIAIAGLTISAERLANVDFSKPYFNASQVVLVKADNQSISQADLDSLLASLQGKKIGFQKGTVGQFYVEGSSSWEFDGIFGAVATQYNSGALAVNDLLSGRIDAVVIDEMPARNFVNNNPGIIMIDIYLTVEEYAIAIPKGNTELKNFIDAIIDRILTDGTFDDLAQTYFGQTTE